MVQFFKTFSKKNNFYSNKFSLYDFLPLKNPKTSLYVCVRILALDMCKIPAVSCFVPGVTTKYSNKFIFLFLSARMWLSLDPFSTDRSHQ